MHRPLNCCLLHSWDWRMSRSESLTTFRHQMLSLHWEKESDGAFEVRLAGLLLERSTFRDLRESMGKLTVRRHWRRCPLRRGRWGCFLTLWWQRRDGTICLRLVGLFHDDQNLWVPRGSAGVARSVDLRRGATGSSLRSSMSGISSGSRPWRTEVG